jgi:uncharacterized membrane protein YkvI
MHREPFGQEPVLVNAQALKKLVLPGLVFQSVVIAGGYGTGREIAEFFLTLGPMGGLIAMAISTLIWSAVCMVSFEFARRFRHFDYRTFFVQLLGRGWFLFEICYVLQLLLVLAVIAAAAGSILQEVFGLPYLLGVVGMMAAVGFLVFRGSAAIEKFLTGWSVLLYIAYGILFVWSMSRFGGAILSSFTSYPVMPGWVIGGVKYAAYNLAVIPAVLFTIRHHETRSESVGAGLLAGPIAMIPALLFYLAMVGHYPAILNEAVPANYVLDVLGSRAFQIVFQAILFGTLIETGTGMIHAINERIASVYSERNTEMPAFLRPAVAVVLLILGTLLARFGIVALIARGYGTLTWAFLAVFVIPVLTLGVWKLRAAGDLGPSGGT